MKGIVIMIAIAKLASNVVLITAQVISHHTMIAAIKDQVLNSSNIILSIIRDFMFVISYTYRKRRLYCFSTKKYTVL